MDPVTRLRELGLSLPKPPAPVGNYVRYAEAGPMLFLSGQGPADGTGKLARGKVGHDFDVPQAYQQARLVGLSLIALMQDALGDLRRVKRVVKVFGMVNAVPDFEDHPRVINGCSDLMVEVFGEAGRHARSAVGMASLPMGIPVEIEAVVEFTP